MNDITKPTKTQPLQDPRYVLTISPSCGLKIYTFEPGHTPKLKWMQNRVGGYIEAVRARFPGFVLIVDEEGLIKNKLRNLTASALSDGYSLHGKTIVMREAGDNLIPMTWEELKMVLPVCTIACTNSFKYDVGDDDNDEV